ncbi:hypothetical protein BD770DRAFT_457190 [Pilaira anomala]|nr:hypothetical protein BD770DRAFT_457190 [Pilaira anomala]
MYTLDTYEVPQTMTIRITRGVIDLLKLISEGVGTELCLYAICHLQENYGTAHLRIRRDVGREAISDFKRRTDHTLGNDSGLFQVSAIGNVTPVFNYDPLQPSYLSPIIMVTVAKLRIHHTSVPYPNIDRIPACALGNIRDKGKGRQVEVVPKNNVSKTYINWDKPVSERNQQSPMDYLVDFLLVNGGENTNQYLGCNKSNEIIKGTKVALVQIQHVINKCVEYFKHIGVDVGTGAVKSKMERILGSMYQKAYAEYNGSGNGNMGNTKKNGRQEFEDHLNKICPRFYEIKEVLGSRRTDKYGGKRVYSFHIRLTVLVHNNLYVTRMTWSRRVVLHESSERIYSWYISRTGTPFVVNSNLPFNSVDINEGHSSDDDRNSDSDNTNYYTTDEDPLCEAVEVVETVDVNPDEPTSQSREETRSWNSSASTSSSNKKRKINQLDEMIKAEAKKSNEEFMNRIESLYARSLENEKILKAKAIENNQKMALTQQQIDVFMKSNDFEWISEAEREKKVDEIQKKYFSDNN